MFRVAAVVAALTSSLFLGSFAVLAGDENGADQRSAKSCLTYSFPVYLAGGIYSGTPLDDLPDNQVLVKNHCTFAVTLKTFARLGPCTEGCNIAVPAASAAVPARVHLPGYFTHYSQQRLLRHSAVCPANLDISNWDGNPATPWQCVERTAAGAVAVAHVGQN